MEADSWLMPIESLEPNPLERLHALAEDDKRLWSHAKVPRAHERVMAISDTHGVVAGVG